VTPCGKNSITVAVAAIAAVLVFLLTGVLLYYHMLSSNFISLLSRQIVPNILGEVLQDKDATTKPEKVMEAMLQKRKVDIDALKKGFRG